MAAGVHAEAGQFEAVKVWEGMQRGEAGNRIERLGESITVWWMRIRVAMVYAAERQREAAQVCCGGGGDREWQRRVKDRDHAFFQ